MSIGTTVADRIQKISSLLKTTQIILCTTLLTTYVARGDIVDINDGSVLSKSESSKFLNKLIVVNPHAYKTTSYSDDSAAIHQSLNRHIRSDPLANDRDYYATDDRHYGMESRPSYTSTSRYVKPTEPTPTDSNYIAPSSGAAGDHDYLDASSTRYPAAPTYNYDRRCVRCLDDRYYDRYDDRYDDRRATGGGYRDDYDDRRYPPPPRPPPRGGYDDRREPGRYDEYPRRPVASGGHEDIPRPISGGGAGGGYDDRRRPPVDYYDYDYDRRGAASVPPTRYNDDRYYRPTYESARPAPAPTYPVERPVQKPYERPYEKPYDPYDRGLPPYDYRDRDPYYEPRRPLPPTSGTGVASGSSSGYDTGNSSWNRDRYYYDRYDNRRGYEDPRGSSSTGYATPPRGGWDYGGYRPWDETNRGVSGWDSAGRGYYFSSGGRPDPSGYWGNGYDRGYAHGYTYGSSSHGSAGSSIGGYRDDWRDYGSRHRDPYYYDNGYRGGGGGGSTGGGYRGTSYLYDRDGRPLPSPPSTTPRNSSNNNNSSHHDSGSNTDDKSPTNQDNDSKENNTSNTG